MGRKSFYFALLCVAALVSHGVWANDYSGNDIAGIESIVDEIENGSEQWRSDANARIDQIRKSDVAIRIVDGFGQPVSGVAVKLELKRHAFMFGGLVDSRRFNGTKQGVDAEFYRQCLADFGFNLSGMNLAMKPRQRDNLSHYVAPYLEWCAARNIDVRGHALIWPGWKFMPDESPALETDLPALKAYCAELVKFGAETWKVVEWDVINEPRANRDVQKLLGHDVMVDWFNIAEENKINPHTRWVLNENQVISDTHANLESPNIARFKESLQILLDGNAPVSALGFQSRFRRMTPAERIWDRLNLFNEYNLPIAATELEMRHENLPIELDRAIMTERVMTVYFSHPLVYQITAWTFMDQGNDLNRQLVNFDGTPSLQGKAWLYLMKNRWHTDETDTTDAQGRVSFRGFKGDYTVTVTQGDTVIERAFRLGDDARDISGSAQSLNIEI